MLDFVSDLAQTLGYAGGAAQFNTTPQLLGDSIEKLLNLVTKSSIVVLKYVRRPFAGKLNNVVSPFAD